MLALLSIVCPAVLEKLAVAQLVKKFPTIYETQKLIIFFFVHSSTVQLLAWASIITPPPPIP